jgi:hypothetical protein
VTAHYLLPEQQQLNALLALAADRVRTKIICTIDYQGIRFPVQACFLGSESATAPVLAVVGGVHGVERIGSQVVLAFMETLIQRLHWDHSLISGLENLRLLFIPIVNPVGVYLRSRANGNGVDLMRNAPVDADQSVPWLVGGQRLSNRLPWYRGKAGGAMQPEAQGLTELIRDQTRTAPFTLLLDVHSGYGFNDQLWFPLAGSHKPIRHLAEIYALYQLLDSTYPNLSYVVEPQSNQYLTHGDLWDYSYLQQRAAEGIFLPFTLEMGSWNWIKKNPWQMGSFYGLFNPVKPHRTQRVLRRHTMLLEFLIRAARAYENWLPADEQRGSLTAKALKLWYANKVQ